MPEEKPSIAVLRGVALPDSVSSAFALTPVGPGVGRVEARLLLTGRETFFAWARANPDLPTLALEGGRVVAHSFLRGHLVPPEGPVSGDLVGLFRGVLQASASLTGGAPPPRAQFTRRERQVLELLLRGEAVASMARELGISPSTVRQYLLNVRNKLDAPNLTLVLLKAAQHGLIDWPPLPGAD